MNVTTEMEQSLNTGLQCLVYVSQHHNIRITEEQIRRGHLPKISSSTNIQKEISKAGKSIGLEAKIISSITWDKLLDLSKVFPAIAKLKNGNFVTLVGLKQVDGKDAIAVMDPASEPVNSIFFLDQERFLDSWSGDLILFKQNFSVLDEKQPFGLKWFIPELFRQRVFMRDVAISAIVLHFLALAVPVYLQITIDKVLAHQAYSTLYVLTIGVCLALLFDAVFTYLRQYFLLHATNKIDIRLAKKTFSHLLKLPIAYFDTGTAGVTTQHMQQAEKIRQFLTGRLFLTFLDATILLLLVPVLFYYSVTLAWIVLTFAGIIALVILSLIPTFRGRLQDLYNATAERQSLLVETIQGMSTVKALAVEPQRRRDWEERSARAVTMNFRVGKISLTASTAMGFLQKLMSVAIIGIGAQAVFDQTLTVGSLIAFQMLSGRVVSPLVQIVSLVHEYQEAALSVRMLGSIMNHPSEGKKESGGLEPVLKGKIEFKDVSFRYTADSPLSLVNMSFNLPAGKVVGIVGKSGSGKSTLAKLIQGLYPVQEGIIRMDSIDIREIDMSYLRQNIGVVLQDNFLFRGSVRDNISMTKPTASFDEIVESARVSGADEFIERLPQGYDSILEENGSNLSGGQKQRLAIARAILTQPRILILDEAASALDPESEAIFLDNLKELVIGRTVIIISHRLSTLTQADAIMVLDKGEIIDAGKHGELLNRCDIYTRLWQQQTKHL